MTRRTGPILFIWKISLYRIQFINDTFLNLTIGSIREGVDYYIWFTALVSIVCYRNSYFFHLSVHWDTIIIVITKPTISIILLLCITRNQWNNVFLLFTRVSIMSILPWSSYVTKSYEIPIHNNIFVRTIIIIINIKKKLKDTTEMIWSKRIRTEMNYFAKTEPEPWTNMRIRTGGYVFCFFKTRRLDYACIWFDEFLYCRTDLNRSPDRDLGERCVLRACTIDKTPGHLIQTYTEKLIRYFFYFFLSLLYYFFQIIFHYNL